MSEDDPSLRMRMAIDYAFGLSVVEIARKYGRTVSRTYQHLQRVARFIGVRNITQFHSLRVQNVLLDRVRGQLPRYSVKARTPEEFYAELVHERQEDMRCAFSTSRAG